MTVLALTDHDGVAGVPAAVEAGKETATRVGNLVAGHVIPRPAPELLAFFTA